MSVAINPDIIHLDDTARVPGLFGIRHPDRDREREYTPVPLRHGEICLDACWMRDEQVRPITSALCPHGGAP